jgi:hypothetical protein
MATNANLYKAKAAKNDEFYTQLTDVSNELMHYKQHFKDKIVYCNCDDPTWSAFWKYFHLNFKALGLKKLISTHYDKNEPTYKMEYTGGNDNDIEVGTITPLEGNGDFRNQECLDLMDESDIVVTNPPFSLAREYLACLVEHEKKFLIVGDINWIPYKEVFPLVKSNSIWLGNCSVKEFVQPDGTIKKFGNKLWFTNLDHKKRHEKLILWKNYSPEEYPTYDNYDAIEVSKITDLPVDFDGVMGVPITYLDKHNPEQFEILGYTGGLGWNEQNDVQTTKEYVDAKQHNPDGSVTSGGKVNTGAALRYDSIPADRYYSASNVQGYLLRTYGRILIRKKAGT